MARRSVQVGQRVAPGNVLMTVVPLDEVWVDANFKENQLAHLRPGQPVTLVADATAPRSSIHGKVAGFGAGTGSAFALLPAQNATGNWIKVVQRVPVRVASIRRSSRRIRCRSASRCASTSTRTGARPSACSASRARSRPTKRAAFDPIEPQADQVIARIIAENSVAANSTGSAVLATRKAHGGPSAGR